MRPASLFLVVSCLLWTHTWADEIVDDAAEARQLVAGPKQRSWILEAVVAELGGAECEAGERYIFFAGGDLVIERCDAGTWVRENLTWAIHGGGAQGLSIEIGGKPHDLILVKRAERIDMWIIALADAKDEPTETRTLIYPLD